jgi:hypothetical protein
MSRLFNLFALLFILGACGVFPERVEETDERIGRLLNARATIDTARYGFSPVDKSGQFRLEGKRKGFYDAMLHITGPASNKTIAFRKVGSEYHWIGEQEIIKGPRECESPDGMMREQLVITFEAVPMSGAPLNTLLIRYHGEDPSLANARDLSLEQIRPVLARWMAQAR